MGVRMRESIAPSTPELMNFRKIEANGEQNYGCAIATFR